MVVSGYWPLQCMTCLLACVLQCRVLTSGMCQQLLMLSPCGVATGGTWLTNTSWGSEHKASTGILHRHLHDSCLICQPFGKVSAGSYSQSNHLWLPLHGTRLYMDKGVDGFSTLYTVKSHLPDAALLHRLWCPKVNRPRTGSSNTQQQFSRKNQQCWSSTQASVHSSQPVVRSVVPLCRHRCIKVSS